MLVGLGTSLGLDGKGPCFHKQARSTPVIWAPSRYERLGGYFQSSEFMGRSTTLESKTYPRSGVTKEFVGTFVGIFSNLIRFVK